LKCHERYFPQRSCKDIKLSVGPLHAIAWKARRADGRSISAQDAARRIFIVPSPGENPSPFPFPIRSVFEISHGEAAARQLQQLSSIADCSEFLAALNPPPDKVKEVVGFARDLLHVYAPFYVSG
jgi:hypothetical protein